MKLTGTGVAKDGLVELCTKFRHVTTHFHKIQSTVLMLSGDTRVTNKAFIHLPQGFKDGFDGKD
eukprot:scaffold158749_cov28-Prasinocladus_malaysianus.AAC.1